MPFRRRTPAASSNPAVALAPTSQTGWLKLPDASGSDVTVKPLVYLPVYEEMLGPLRGSAFSMLELGVWKGDSLTMWRDAFPEATIVGVDLDPPQLELGPNVHIVVGDQSDAALLAGLRAQFALEGFAVIIDDASHIGQVSARSLQALYMRHLRPGGLYILEDWGTGYMTSWPDGAELSSDVDVGGLDEIVDAGDAEAQRLPSHDLGMVGLVKRLVDHTAAGTLAMLGAERLQEPLPIAWMRVQDGMVIVKKAGG